MRTMAPAGDKDHFGDLTDDLLKHVLSFLPPDEALQTCVLDTRWRGLWRRTTSLVLIFDDEGSRVPFSDNIEKLAKLIVQLRGNSPLLKCVINTCPDSMPDDAPWSAQSTYINTKLLIQYAITCQVNELIVSTGDQEYEPLMLDMPLISQHLRTIDLYYVNLEHLALDFSGCPVLENLSMVHCGINAHKITSKTLKRLCITDFCTIPDDLRLRICGPGLITLRLDDFDGLTPFLEYMPFLVTAYVGLSYECKDFCYRHREDCDYPDSGCHAFLVKEGVLLNGLSNAVNLELIALPDKFLYRWDLKGCPIFDNLKTLLLNEWFAATDLVCILKHTPILEMLTLQLDDTEKLARAAGAQETIEQSFVCNHLKIVNIECPKDDTEGISKILKIMSTCGILREKIIIKDPCSLSDYFSFQKPPHSFDCGPSCCSSHH